MTIQLLKYDKNWAKLKTGDVISLASRYSGLVVYGVVVQAPTKITYGLVAGEEMAVIPITIECCSDSMDSLIEKAGIEMSVKHNCGRLVIDESYDWKLEMICDT
jgi:hypothetical protein